MPIVTIGRQFGAGGEAVGRIVAQRLKADLLDNQIMTEVARRLELPKDEVEAQDENPGSFLNRLLTALGSASVDFSVPPEVAAWTPPYADPAFDPRRAILNITQQVIREAARSGNVVIVGRGAGYLLRDRPGLTSVFLHAEEGVRLRAVMDLFGLDEDAARRRIKHTDANRSAYVRQVYGHDWMHPAHYDLVLDSGRLGYEVCAEVILAAAKLRAG
jgi:cytidylate kinase